MPSIQNSILVMPSDIEMMRSVLIRAGFDKDSLVHDEKLCRKAALLVMNHFRDGMVDPKQLSAELLFYFGRQEHPRANPPARLPRYAIQGMPVESCVDSVNDYVGGLHPDISTGAIRH